MLNTNGELEVAGVEWQGIEEAEGYNVYYKQAAESDSAFEQLDSELIRQYSNYLTSGVLGVKQALYVIKI